MDNRIKAFFVFAAMLLIGTAWIVWVSDEQKIADKAAQYDLYKIQIEEYETCLPMKTFVTCTAPIGPLVTNENARGDK